MVRKNLLPLAVISLAAGAAGLLARGGSPSRESLLPLSRAAAEHVKGVDRATAVAFPLPPDAEREVGASLARRVPVVEHPLGARWREFGAEAASSALVTRQRGRYEFRVAAGGGVNAFAVPGGFVYATPALLERFARDEDALLFVLGHEIAHVELGHCADGYRLRAGARGAARKTAGAVLSVGRLFAQLHFSPSQELEADAFAARLVAERRRDPAGGLRALGLLGLTGDTGTKRDPGTVVGEGVVDYFRSHPGSWERRAALEREILDISARGAR